MKDPAGAFAADTYLRALGSRVAEQPAVEPPLLVAEYRLLQ